MNADEELGWVQLSDIKKRKRKKKEKQTKKLKTSASTINLSAVIMKLSNGNIVEEVRRRRSGDYSHDSADKVTSDIVTRTRALDI